MGKKKENCSNGKNGSSKKNRNLSAKKGSKKRKQKIVDPNAPKKPASSYFYFLSIRRNKLKLERPDLSHNESVIHLSKEWNCLTEPQKLVFEKLAEADRIRYEREYEEYLKTNPQIDSSSKKSAVNSLSDGKVSSKPSKASKDNKKEKVQRVAKKVKKKQSSKKTIKDSKDKKSIKRIVKSKIKKIDNTESKENNENNDNITSNIKSIEENDPMASITFSKKKKKSEGVSSDKDKKEKPKNFVKSKKSINNKTEILEEIIIRPFINDEVLNQEIISQELNETQICEISKVEESKNEIKSQIIENNS